MSYYCGPGAAGYAAEQAAYEWRARAFHRSVQDRVIRGIPLLESERWAAPYHRSSRTPAEPFRHPHRSQPVPERPAKELPDCKIIYSPAAADAERSECTPDEAKQRWTAFVEELTAHLIRFK